MENTSSVTQVAALALQAADTALRDIIRGREEGRAIDTKILKDVTAALKDLNGITEENTGAGSVTVCFEGFAGEAAV